MLNRAIFSVRFFFLEADPDTLGALRPPLFEAVEEELSFSTSMRLDSELGLASGGCKWWKTLLSKLS